ncbi:hypothetical protein [Clostridium baratii]|uniref:hypothetical protein n=1 Tax=Clostridium baratii TaxID=1561 RepID=UPI0029023C69|nr:hypothetical protein [Clostridium baratii]MDU1053338.1 hypothetical protein [Clostridium baratii]
MKNKVNEGFELIYWNLSYRRKFIRTLWMTPLCFLLIGYIIFNGNNIFINRIVPIVLVMVYVCQLIYTYTKWKNDKES